MSRPVTFVNIIDVDPAQQPEVIALLEEGTEQVISRRPGFVSATILASLDERRVINVARWQRIEDAQATQGDPAAAAYAQRVAAIARPTPGVFTVASETSR